MTAVEYPAAVECPADLIYNDLDGILVRLWAPADKESGKMGKQKRSSDFHRQVIVDWKPDAGKKTPIYRQIIDYVCQKVASGDWVIGSRLPSQRKLAELLGVNRSTVMSAMEELIAFGILEGQGGKGTRVASNTWSVLMSAAPPDWGSYIRSGSFAANVPVVQIINRLEFEDGYIRLGTGEIAPSMFPTKLMEEIFRKLPQKIRSLNYLGPQGLLPLRQELSKRLSSRGIDSPPESILITSGSLQALQLISVCMLKPGSVVYTEKPSYLKSLQVFPSAGMELAGVSMDGQGIMPWELAAEMERRNLCGAKTPGREAGRGVGRETGREVKPEAGREERQSLLYTIPSFQNPTGLVMSQERRVELFQLCSNQRLPMIEDDAYGELWLDEEPPRPIKTLDQNGMLLYLGTISKTLAPGLRVGWLAGPESVAERLGDVKMQVDYGASSLSQWALAELLAGGRYDDYLVSLRRELRERRDLALGILERNFKELAQWDRPSGGFYIWLRLKKQVNTDHLFHQAAEAGLLLNPGSIYDFAKNQALRLSYAYAEPAELETGLIRLAELLTSQKEISI